MKYSPGNEPMGRRDENPSIPSLDHTPVPAQPIATVSLAEIESVENIDKPDGEAESEKDFSASLDALAKRVNP